MERNAGMLLTGTGTSRRAEERRCLGAGWPAPRMDWKAVARVPDGGQAQAVASLVPWSRLMGRAVRVGVLGLRRGVSLARLAQHAGMQLVAVCERDDRRREVSAGELDAAAYREVEAFLDHPMDAVILVNDFDQHAPVAIRALDRGLSVLSETAACRTLAEGVALVEAAERSAGVYMFAENYPHMPLTREMRRRCAAGDIGEVRYAEAEYLDEPDDLASMVNDRGHWRARLPATYYCTHSLAARVPGHRRRPDGRRGGRDADAARLRRRRAPPEATRPGRALRRRAVGHRDPGDAVQPGRERAYRGSRPAAPGGPPGLCDRRLVPQPTRALTQTATKDRHIEAMA